MPEPGPSMYLGCEDEMDELHRRVADSANHYHASLGELKDMHVLSLAGQECILGRTNRNGLVEMTPLFHRLTEAACDIRPKLIGLDTASDIFVGNENNRAEVTQF